MWCVKHSAGTLLVHVCINYDTCPLSLQSLKVWDASHVQKRISSPALLEVEAAVNIVFSCAVILLLNDAVPQV